MDKIPTPSQMFLGNMGGSMGEVAAIALIIGFVYLLWKKGDNLAYPCFHNRDHGNFYGNTLVCKS